MMKTVFTVLLAILSMTIKGQTYTALWKQSDDAEQKDLPRTQYDVLMKIVVKAQKEGEYGQLMAAELACSRVMTTISPDSLLPAVERMEQRRKETDNKTLATVYAVVLKKIYEDNRQLERHGDISVTLDEETCRQLAAVKAADYQPLTVIGKDSRWFDNDLLSVVGYELRDFSPLHAYYNKVGNRVASMMTALEMARQQRGVRKAYLQTLDSLIARYGDLPEAGELAVERYRCMADDDDISEEQRWNYTEEALHRWGSYSRTVALRNAQQELTKRQYEAKLDKRLVTPEEKQQMQCQNLRNISRLTMRIYRAKVNGNNRLNPADDKDYRKLKPLLTELPELQVTRQYSGKQAYDLFNDSIPLPALPVGVYMIEMESYPATEVSRRMYYVSNVRTMAEALPGGRMRYVVVDAVEGQPLKGATIELSGYANGRLTKLASLTTDAQGEAVYQYTKNRPSNIYAYTKTDKYCQPNDGFGGFSYYNSDRRVVQTQLFTDRSIYRPGQTVHVAAILYEVNHGYEQKALEGEKLTLTLRDANYEVVGEKDVVTNGYGSCAADFTLPAEGLTGRFTIDARNGGCDFRVEEYKRPTFEVKFDNYTQDYQDGDTVTVRGVARSYAGVPVQGARAKYKVVRRRSFWWWAYSSYWNMGEIGKLTGDQVMAEGEAVTGNDGSFTVQMPMTLPKTDYPMFYQFVCQADITDQAGETHQGHLSLPLGNRKTALSIDLPEKMRADQMPKMVLHLRNAAGNDIEATVRYKIDNGKWVTVNTNTPVTLPKLSSGQYRLYASEISSEEKPVERQFVIFSLDDRRPVVKTDDWFYVSDNKFPVENSRTGQTSGPVTVQVGSSAKDVHIVYSIISGDNIIESGAVDCSNQLINRKLTYKPSYGNGVLVTFAWVKQGRCYHHEATISRPLPDKKLKMEWRTFRDRLTPGQEEEWSLSVKTPDGKPADALLMATLYDKSLDQIASHQWNFSPYQYLPLPHTQWQYVLWGNLYVSGRQKLSPQFVASLHFSHFDSSLFPQLWMNSRTLGSIGRPMMAMAKSASVMEFKEKRSVVAGLNYESDEQSTSNAQVADAVAQEEDESATEPEVPLRENLQETAFFYPQLATDADGQVTMKFTLPESLTTWRFLGLAHTADLCLGTLEGEAVAKKDLMVQPNMPRFVREGDQATISARIINTCERDLSGTASLMLIDPETQKTVLARKEPFAVKAGETSSVTFTAAVDASFPSLLIAKVMAAGEGYSDGEQHYLPVLPNRERVTVTFPFTQNEPGTKTINLTQLFPADAKQGKLTMEYTNNPVWLMIQALPTVGHPYDDCAVCQAASLYANSIGKFIIDQVPQAKTVFEQWKRERGNETSLQSQLQKNQELKDLVLSETPWVADADREQEQRQRLADFFDDNQIKQRLKQALDKLEKLQRGDGSWSWWPDMPGSVYMTVSIAEMMVRLNQMTGKQQATEGMLDGAMDFLGREMEEMVREMKKEEKKGHRQYFPSFTALEWLYLCKLDGRELPKGVKQANDYLIKLLKKDAKNQTVYEKAMSAIILESPTYVKSLKEFTVYKEEMGRYYDTPRAGYSWRDYRIPTQVAAIEAIQRLTPDDRKTLDEMRRWLLQEKRTQAWDTPLNGVDAVYAFLCEKGMVRSEKLIAEVPTVLKLDNQKLETPKATAGIGYVKTAQPYGGEKTFSAQKTSEGTSWGAVYAQFVQSAHTVKDQASGVSVQREILCGSDRSPLTGHQAPLKVGDRVTVRLTIQSERDLDFVQLQDKRAACMEPVRQISGYNWIGGYYVTPRDHVTNYYFDGLSKGKHVIETDYYIDRAGQYETGTCTVQCAYAPEYRGTTHSQTLITK